MTSGRAVRTMTSEGQRVELFPWTYAGATEAQDSASKLRWGLENGPLPGAVAVTGPSQHGARGQPERSPGRQRERRRGPPRTCLGVPGSQRGVPMSADDPEMIAALQAYRPKWSEADLQLWPVLGPVVVDWALTVMQRGVESGYDALHGRHPARLLQAPPQDRPEQGAAPPRAGSTSSTGTRPTAGARPPSRS
jgi:hypothetical protein